MRLFTVGLVLTIVGMFIIAIGIPLAAYLSYGGHTHFAGFVWIFPFPIIAFGNISHMSPILSILSILAFIAFIIFIILLVVSYVKSRRVEEELE